MLCFYVNGTEESVTNIGKQNHEPKEKQCISCKKYLTYASLINKKKSFFSLYSIKRHSQFLSSMSNKRAFLKYVSHKFLHATSDKIKPGLLLVHKYRRGRSHKV